MLPMLPMLPADDPGRSHVGEAPAIALTTTWPMLDDVVGTVNGATHYPQQERGQDAGGQTSSGPDIVATIQLSFLPGLARRGALRAQIEAVRVHEAYRNSGIRAAIVTWQEWRNNISGMWLGLFRNW